MACDYFLHASRTFPELLPAETARVGGEAVRHWGNASTTFAPGVSLAISSAAAVVGPTTSPLQSGLRQFPHENSPRPCIGPAACSAAVTAPHGTARTMMSPNATASAGVPVRAFGPGAASTVRSLC